MGVAPSAGRADCVRPGEQCGRLGVPGIDTGAALPFIGLVTDPVDVAMVLLGGFPPGPAAGEQADGRPADPQPCRPREAAGADLTGPSRAAAPGTP
ncbi:hypothetical protein GCM10009864_24720 [Streptomyces lunalinharesii]|uniref:Uncharacterized protein n=1 Tax=Streptomyces lunalinharesii TaxID=333384 RepID=A0ABP6E392_9ACTN